MSTQIVLNRSVYSSVKTLLLFAQLDSSLPDDQNQPVYKRCVLIPTVNIEPDKDQTVNVAKHSL